MIFILLGITGFLLILLFWFFVHHFLVWRRHVREEVREAQWALHNSFDALHQDMREQFEVLERTRNKRKLTPEEEQSYKHIKESLDIAEKFIQKELGDVEKETN